jgi:ribulose-phosphate 3-epimerase
MRLWSDLPRNRLLADVSLWSADLANLQAEMARVSALADSFHLDVADAHFIRGLLFFPDLVRALRPHTNKPFHVHLMAENPAELIPDFVDAGADLITIHAELDEEKAGAAIETIRRAGIAAGIALRLDTPVSASVRYLASIEALLLLGTEVGVKGRDLHPNACARLTEASEAIQEHGGRVRLVADGAIRVHTVPLLRRAGAAVIVPGSLAFQSEDMAGTAQWLHSLP